MKNLSMPRLLFAVLVAACCGVQTSVAQDAAKQPQEAASGRDARRNARETEGVLKSKMALEALKSRNFVIEMFDPKSTAKTRGCYNFIEVNGDSVFFQAAWPSFGRFREGFNQSEGVVKNLTLTPDKKGNLKVQFDADMVSVESRVRGYHWPMKMRFTLFQNSNVVPLLGGATGVILLPSQAQTMRLNGSMPPRIR